jgi:plasmid stabilization system protein ParE
MSFSIIVGEEAGVEIRDAFTWYEGQSKGLGFEFLRVVDAALTSIVRAPALFPIVHANVHRSIIRRFPYSIYYVIESETILVVSCFHNKRNLKKLEQRIS